jgi:hypothetical protein
MRDNDFSNPIFHDEAKARAWLEARLWPDGPICPHCGVVDQETALKGKSHRAGLLSVQTPAASRSRSPSGRCMSVRTFRSTSG